jgi:ABC-2 type transport system permease protein
VEAGQVDVAIVLQPGFDQRLQNGEQNHMNFYIWGESLIRHRMTVAAVMSNTLVTVLDRPMPVTITPVALDGGNVPWFDRLLPLLVLLAVIMNGILVPGSTLVEEKQRRTLRALLMTPISLGEVLVAKGLLGMVMSLGMGLLILLINRSLGTQPVLLLVVLALGSLLAVCLGLILGVISKDIPSMFATIKGLMLLLYAPGIIYAIPQIPQWIARFFPTYYIFDPVIQITQNSANAAEILMEMAVLIGLILLVMLALAGLVKKTRLQEV